MGSGYAALAQDPSVGGIVISPNPIMVGQPGSITANFGNGSSTAIPQSATATYTFNLPPNIGVTSASIVATSPPAGTTANLSITRGAYDATNGTIITVRSNLGDVPGNALYNLVLSIVGVRTTSGLPPSVLSNAAASGVGTNNPSNDNASTPVAVTAGAMPVALVSFTAQSQNNRTVELAWTTSLETSNKGFLIERSKDLKHFDKVGEVSELAPESNALKNYKLLDLTPYAGTSYYRLTQIDLSGKATVFPAVSVVLRDAAYGVFPNPVVSDGRFALGLDEPETATINFYSANGHALPLQKAGIESGNLLVKTQGNLSAGVYIVTVEERGQTRQHRIVVK
ncbi:hypothetical protein GCM10027190_07620 [Spirosoma areae]